MLSVSIHKDIGEYTEKVVGKLSFRTLVCVIGGFAAAVGAASFSYFVLRIEVSNATMPVMACSMPFWLAGFWRPSGMKLEAFISLWFQHTFTDDRVLYIPSVNLLEPKPTETIAERADRMFRRRAKRRGAEAYEPSKRS